MARPRKGRGVGTRLNSLQKGRESARQDQADADAMRREHGDFLVRVGPDKFDAFAKELRESIAAENEVIEDDKTFKIEYDLSRVLEVSYLTVMMSVRFNSGAFADAFGPRLPYIDISFYGNPKTASNIPGLQRIPGAPPIGRASQEHKAELVTDGKEVAWRLDGVQLEDDDLAGELLERFEQYYRQRISG